MNDTWSGWDETTIVIRKNTKDDILKQLADGNRFILRGRPDNVIMQINAHMKRRYNSLEGQWEYCITNDSRRNLMDRLRMKF